MSFTFNNPINARRLVDTGLSNTVALSSSQGTVNTGWLNLKQPGATAFYYTANTGGSTTAPSNTANAPSGPYVATERVILNVSTTASANGGNATNGAGNVTLYLQQALTLSNGAVDTGNITNVPLRSQTPGTNANVAYAVAVATGTNANSTGNNPIAAINIYDSLPPGIQQYIRIQAVSGANTGNTADASVTIQVLF